MARVEGYSDFILCYKTELKSVVRGHHVYQSVWTSTVGENLFTTPDKREKALSYDEFAIGAYKDEKCSLLVGHLPIEISSLSYLFLKNPSENKIIVKITGKREREIGLVVPANFVYIAKDKNCSIILKAKLEKRKTLFQDLKLKFYKKVVYRQFPGFFETVLTKTNFVFMFSLSFILLSAL